MEEEKDTTPAMSGVKQSEGLNLDEEMDTSSLEAEEPEPMEITSEPEASQHEPEPMEIASGPEPEPMDTTSAP